MSLEIMGKFAYYFLIISNKLGVRVARLEIH